MKNRWGKLFYPRAYLFVAPFVRFFYYLLPGVVVFNGTANAVVGLFGMAPAAEGAETYSEEEIRTLIAQSTRQGILEKDEESRLSGVFSLENTSAREIMVPAPTSSRSPPTWPSTTW